MEAIRGFLAMGGYAVFVWSAFGVAAVVLVYLLISSRHYWKAQAAAVAELEAARPRRRRSREGAT